MMMVEHYKKCGYISRLSEKTPFVRGLRSWPNGLRRRRPICRHIRNDLNFCKSVGMPTPQSIQELNVFGHQKHVASRPGVWYVVFSPKNYWNFIKWKKATKLVMHPSDDGGTLWKKFEFIWRMSKKTPIGRGLRSYPNGLRRRRSIFRYIRNDLKFCKWVGMATPTVNPRIERIWTSKTCCVTSGVCYVVFSLKKL